MGLFSRVPNTEAPALTAAAAALPQGYGSGGASHINGWAYPIENHLEVITLPDILGDERWLPLSRAEAISVPAVAAARNVLSQIARQPLVAIKGGVNLETQPSWLHRTRGAVPPQMRMLWTLDDLIFFGYSLWWTERGADGSILEATRVAYPDWRFDSAGKIEVKRDNGEFEGADEDEVILFIGPVDGLLTSGARTIRAARDLENTRAQRLRAPAAITELHLTGGDNKTLSAEQMKTLQEKWIAARRSANGAVAVTPPGVEVIDHGEVTTDLFIDSQNQIAVNIAQHLGVPSSLIDAAVAVSGGSSMTYQNLQTQRSLWLDFGFAMWADSISGRLSQDDCVPRGTYVKFDLSSLVQLPTPGTGPALED
jgi:hypothetical protein